MIHLFSTKFELKHSELDLIKEQLSIGEAVLSDQAAKPVPTLAELDPISEDKEDKEEGGKADNVADSDSDFDSDAEVASKQILPATQPAVRVKQVQAQNKQAYSQIETPNGALSQLPHASLGEEGRPERHWKQPKLPAGFEIDRI
jgi:hypothetical protein